jgi:hypothetical protein
MKHWSIKFTDHIINWSILYVLGIDTIIFWAALKIFHCKDPGNWTLLLSMCIWLVVISLGHNIEKYHRDE